MRQNNYWYDASNRLSNIRNDAGSTTVGLSYDVQGNLSNKNGQAYTFDYGNRLRVVKDEESYRYDAEGRRVQAIRTGVGNNLSMYGKSGQLLYEERAGKGAIEYIQFNGSLLATRTAGTVSYQHTDALGSPVATTNAAGQVTEQTQYEPYGAAIGKTVDGVGYTGHVMDGPTELTYMQQRYYDPACGCFVSTDAVTAYDSGDMRLFNRYAYAFNNPYKFTDPDGRCPQCLWGAPIGAGVNIVVQMATAKGSFSERFNQISWGQVAVATAAGALSGGVSAIASTATTTVGTIGANVVGNMAVGAVATQASAQVEGRTASVGEVVQGAALSGGASGLGAAIESVPGTVARSASAGMTQTQRTATADLLGGIKETTPGFKYTNPAQTAANAAGAAASASPGLKPLIENKKEMELK